MRNYNATLYTKHPDGSISVAAACVFNGKVIACNAFQNFTSWTEVYDVVLRKFMERKGCQFFVALDGCEGYKKALEGLALPPTYKA